MDVRDADLNLLVVLGAVAEHRSVTRAAEAVGLSQPAMSAALSRLRALFDDRLFVRSGAEMKPTPRALELAAPVQRVLDTVRHDILQRQGFDAATTTRTFTLAMPDIGEVHFLPALMRRMARDAAAARVRTVSLPRHAAAQALESGAADLAVGFFPDLHKAGFFQQKLFDNPHVCLMRKGHPLASRRLTLKAFLAASHVVVRPEGREHVFEQHLQQRGLNRHVVLELSHYMSVLPVLEATDCIATVPRDLADVCSRYAGLRISETPVKAPVIAVHQFWHERFHKDPANLWLRRLVQDEFRTERRQRAASTGAAA